MNHMMIVVVYVSLSILPEEVLTFVRNGNIIGTGNNDGKVIMAHRIRTKGSR